ncbi:uncharacterized protein LOC112502580 [Cynara cardunculus var. scolymus]|uniref:uncharacterized protein LOC112502580 n=1 Tax=Cynara cardunculus var. scolymus TaxID=59895 RepID=UPI000D6237E4|nr:uncharacterized protein LOC112502580 [Cynara cardunculus var. scolymus]
MRGCINQVEMRNPSGASEQDIMNEAKELLKLDGSYKKGFKFDHVWKILKDSESLSNVTASTQYQRQSPYQSPSSGPGSSSGTDAGLPSLTIHDVEGTQRPIGVKKAKSRLQSDNKLETLVKASKKMSKQMAKTTEVMIRRNELQAQKLALEARLADDKLMCIDLTSITDPVRYEFIKNEKIRIARERAQPQVHMFGQGSEFVASQYRVSQHQQFGAAQNQPEGSQNVAGSFSQFMPSGDDWTI